MTRLEREIIDRMIRRAARTQGEENKAGIYSFVKNLIGYRFFGNSLARLEAERIRYNEMLRYVSDLVGLE